MGAEEDKAAAANVKKSAFIFAGRAGEPFSVSGEGFGSSGSLTIGGTPIETSRWNDRSVKGFVPVGAKGAIVLTTTTGKLSLGELK